MTFTFGADPEIFLREKGKPVSAWGIVPGTKENPHRTSVGAVQQDGMAAEFNIEPARNNDFDRFNLNIVQTLRELKEVVGKDKSFAKNVVVQDFDPDYLDSMPPEAKELGCDPDYCAYTMQPNPKPDGTRTFRTAAGHAHFGWGADIPVDNEEHLEICAGFVKMLDATVGMYMTFIDREPRRRELYGKAGAFRPKSYGVEYRTPSNAWIWNKSRRLMMHRLMNQAIQYNRSWSGRYDIVTGRICKTEEDVRRVIDTGDWETAQKILDHWYGGDYGHENDKVWKSIKEEMKNG